MVPIESSCGGAVELRLTYDMCTTRDRGHCCGVTEGSAEWHGAKQHRIFCIEFNAASYVSGMPSDCLLVVQDQFRFAGGSRSGEGQARRAPVAWSGPASAARPSSGNTGSPLSVAALRALCGASTQRRLARS